MLKNMNSEDLIYAFRLITKNDLNIKIGSLYKYNNSNVNHMRKDHIVKDESTMSAYCSDNKIIKGYVRYLNKREKFDYSFIRPDLCVSCVRKYLKENFTKEDIQKMQKNGNKRR